MRGHLSEPLDTARPASAVRVHHSQVACLLDLLCRGAPGGHLGALDRRRFRRARLERCLCLAEPRVRRLQPQGALLLGEDLPLEVVVQGYVARQCRKQRGADLDALLLAARLGDDIEVPSARVSFQSGPRRPVYRNRGALARLDQPAAR